MNIKTRYSIIVSIQRVVQDREPREYPRNEKYNRNEISGVNAMAQIATNAQSHD